MGKKRIEVELDDETIEHLAALGEPIEVLAQLAVVAADGVRHPGRERREQTDGSLKNERQKTDVALAQERQDRADTADEVVQVARRRADELVQSARDEADSLPPGSPGAGTERSRARADRLVAHERSDADATLGEERADRASHPERSLAVERHTTDVDLSGERAHTDTLLVDQREANERMVAATIRAHELAIEADKAKRRAEASEVELRAVAEFREMFIGILGHDLRNPLGSIVMSASVLLESGQLDEHAAQTAARILRGAERMGRMIEQLLDLTRARLGGGLPIAPEPTDLGVVCQQVVEELGGTTQLAIDGDLTGRWDADRLAEALSNLIGNALEYATPGTPVTVSARPDGAEVVVEIHNHGEPIPDDVLPFIFEPFRRAKPREKSALGNLGLGLYIAHQIVLSHGGTLVARSAGGTTIFTMRLPHLPAE